MDMKRSAKNYITITGGLLLLYFTGLAIVAAHEHQQDLKFFHPDQTNTVFPVWYVLIFVLGGTCAAVWAWYRLSDHNTLNLKEVRGQKKVRSRLITESLGGGLAALLAGALAIGSLPSFTLAPGPQIAKEEPQASSEESPASSEVSSEQTLQEENPVPEAAAVVTVEDTRTISDSYLSSDPDTSVILARGAAALSLEQADITKNGDSTNLSRSLERGLNAAILSVPRGSVNILGGSVQSAANGAPVLAASGPNASISSADTRLVSQGGNSPVVLADLGGHDRIVGGVLSSSADHSPVFMADDQGTIQSEGAVAEALGPNSPIVETSGQVTASNLNATASQSAFAVLQGAGSLALSASQFSSDAAATPTGAQGMLVFLPGKDKKAVSSVRLEGCTFSPLSTVAAKGGALFAVSQTQARIDLQSNKVNYHPVLVNVQKGKLELNASNQVLSGDILVDADSELSVNVSGNSILYGSINKTNESKKASLHLDATSKFSIFADVYLSEFTNEDPTNSNVLLNGFHIYVNGELAL